MRKSPSFRPRERNGRPQAPGASLSRSFRPCRQAPIAPTAGRLAHGLSHGAGGT